ncbi:hypothetical protein [Pseudonocardia cypriaca]|nr:hypothetical protein [Pseudonocardia cypriaca]
MPRGSPTTCDLQVSLTVDQEPAGVAVARLVVDEPDGLLVEVDLTGDELALLLAGETIAVPGRVSGIEQPPVDEPATEPDVVEPDVVEPEEPVRASTALDEPPAGTEPIARSTDVRPGEAVVAYIRGRWRDVVVVRRDIGSLLVAYTRPGSFGRVQQRVATGQVRRRLGH